MINRPKRLKSREKTCALNEDLIEYPEGTTIQLAYEFNVFNLSDVNIEIQFNNEGDNLVLEPGEGFEIKSFPIEHAVIKTNGATVKYSYWF